MRAVVAALALLPSVDILDVSRVLQVRTHSLGVLLRAASTIHRVVLLAAWADPAGASTRVRTLATQILVLVLDCLSAASIAHIDRATGDLLAVDKSDSADGVLVVVRVFVAALNQFLLCFLQAKGTHKTLSIARDIDISHVSRVIYPWFAL